MSRMVRFLAGIDCLHNVLRVNRFAWLLPVSREPLCRPRNCRRPVARPRPSSVPLAQADVEQAKTVLIEALDRLDQRLNLDGSNGQDWRKYLEVATLRDQLQSPQGPDKTLLTRIRAHYNSGHDGLELVWFLDTQSGPAQLPGHARRGRQSENPPADFEKTLDKLAASSGRLPGQAHHRRRVGRLASRSGGWKGHGRSRNWSARFEARFVQPNVWGQMSAAVLGAGIAECIDECMPIARLHPRHPNLRHGPCRRPARASNSRPTPTSACSIRSSAAPPPATTSAATAR